MFRSARVLFTATLVVSVLGFVMTLDDDASARPDSHLLIQAPSH